MCDKACRMWWTNWRWRCMLSAKEELPAADEVFDRVLEKVTTTEGNRAIAASRRSPFSGNSDTVSGAVMASDRARQAPRCRAE